MDSQYEPANNGSTTCSANLDHSESAGVMNVNRLDLEQGAADSGRSYSIEAEEDSVSSDSSEDVDEHRLLSVSSAGGRRDGVESTPGTAAATSINLSDSWNEEDIDPFSYYPPLTKWDYFKVSWCSYHNILILEVLL